MSTFFFSVFFWGKVVKQKDSDEPASHETKIATDSSESTRYDRGVNENPIYICSADFSKNSEYIVYICTNGYFQIIAMGKESFFFCFLGEGDLDGNVT